MPASPEDMAAAMIANMKSKTGKTLEQWPAIAKRGQDLAQEGLVGGLRYQRNSALALLRLFAGR